MKLLEYETKKIFSRYEIPIPLGELTAFPAKAQEIAIRLNAPVVVKAQVLVAGRGKAGGILFAQSPEEAKLAAKRLLSAEVRGIRIRSL